MREIMATLTTKTTKQRTLCGICAVATPVCIGLLLGSAGSLNYKGQAGSSLDRCTFSTNDSAYEYPEQPSALDRPAHSDLFEDVCIHGGTERPKEFKPTLPQHSRNYVCACCGEPLFSGESKFDSGTGWPSFSAPIGPGAIGYARDGMFTSTEVHCGSCGSHLGHVFVDGPEPSGLRCTSLLRNTALYEYRG
jgi:peptide-methionine (R)-S-oxide reductase